jgi:hypothetical protein
VTILKAVFAEVNKKQPREFVEQGLKLYDKAGKRAVKLLEEEVQGPPLSEKGPVRGMGKGH